MYENMIVLDRHAEETLQMQIRRQMAIGIVNRQYPLDEPLPSIRQLASELRVSLTTVALAYGALKSDGFVESRPRSGYFVNPDALADPGHALAADAPADVAPPRQVDYGKFFRGRSFNRERVVKPADSLVRYRYPFVCGLVNPALFPAAHWRECVQDSVSAVGVGNCATDFSETDDQALVEQLTQRVLARRGIVAHPDEVLVTVGGQQALYLAVRLLLAPGEAIGVEDPGYPDVVNMAEIEGINVRRLPVDRGGLVLSQDVNKCKALYVTPSHQFPTTVTMPLERKLELLELTRKNGQFVIEDDYEADVSFNTPPPRALKSLDLWGNVIYVGSLSKSLLQGLRMGYLVADREFIREARALRHYMLRHPPVNNQRSVALFLQRGYFDRFVARLTRIYSKRCDVMHAALEEHFPGAAVKPEYGGSIIWLKLPDEVDAGILHQQVEPSGVYFETGGFTFRDESSNRNHIRLGYSVIDGSLIPEGIEKIARAVPRAQG
ncbi:MAG: PLP-dependent aminotransferase family protein [Gammaproteobacteria bacterium]|nr:PLP-dependent aminotransferase family protein [Gammaproteobacteria bacterium]